MKRMLSTAILLLVITAFPSARSQAQALSEVQQATLEAVSDYFNNLRQVEGRFIQQDGTKGRSSGTFYISKPGKIRFDYEAPVDTQVISDGSIVVIWDHSIGSEDVYNLSQTPIKFLVSDNFDLARDTNVSNVFVDSEQVVIEVSDAENIDIGKLTMIFSSYDFTLLQWSVINKDGQQTTVFVNDLVEKDQLPQNLFAINYNELKRYKNKN